MNDYKTYKCMVRWADKTKDTDILDFLGKQAVKERHLMLSARIATKKMELRQDET